MSGRATGGGGVASRDKRNIDTVRNRYNKNGDKWEHFRESKLEKMRAHKANIERRMRAGDNLDNRMYWSQRSDKLKRYSRHESLDPSWYTDNIYSNHSIDLEEQPPIHIEVDEEDEDDGEEEDGYYVDNDKFDRYFARNSDFAMDGPDDNVFFERKRGRAQHSDVEFNYPKSRSCCFGGGYNERPKPQLMPKSSSFSVAGRSVCDMRSTRITRHSESIDFGNNAAEANSGYRKFYCWQNGERDRNCDKYGEVKEIYHIDRDRDIYKKSKNDIMMEQQQGNANCIRNIWRRRDHCKNNILNEINGNYQDDYCDYGLNDKYYLNGRQKYHGFESHFVEEYLIVPEPIKTRPSETHLRHNSLDHHYEPNVKLINDHHHSHIDDIDEDNSNLLFDEMNVPPKPSRSKSLLEVKPPNRYDDDTSSDSTDLDLDDFNFDFEKYWTELDKTASSSTTNARYDLDYRNNNVNNVNGAFKDKNLLLDKYNNGQIRDINLNDRTNDADLDDDIEAYKPNILDLLPSPTHTVARSRYSINKPNRNYQDDLPTPPAAAHDHYLDTDRTISNTNNNRKNSSENRNRRNKNKHNSAISLINNIFSIYKPKKYSPVNCRARTKPDPIMTKSMNVSSTVRPLGAPYNDFMTSIKRPLTLATPRFNGTHSLPSTMDQPYFKIIPEKTGLKISPLYRFGYEDDSKLRLKCTARPLLFPL